jgi:hypothetical protein
MAAATDMEWAVMSLHADVTQQASSHSTAVGIYPARLPNPQQKANKYPPQLQICTKNVSAHI